MAGQICLYIRLDKKEEHFSTLSDTEVYSTVSYEANA